MSLSTTEPSNASTGAEAPGRRSAWWWIAAALALVAGGICLYLAFAAIALGGQVAGCGDGADADCSAVLASRWARWFGIPVGLPAALIYAAILAATWVAAGREPSPRRLRAWYVLVPLATLILAAASWFSGLQLLAIGRVCWYCLAVHGCAIGLAAVLFWNMPHDWRPAADRRALPIGLPPTTTLLLVSLGLAATGVLVAGQLLGKPPSPRFEVATSDPSAAAERGKHAKSASDDDESGTIQLQRYPINLTNAFPPPPAGSPSARALTRKINLLWGKVFVDVRRTPILGSSDADIILFELFDYTCPHCRQLHQYLKEARERYGSQMAVAVVVTPMSPDCNRYVHEPPAESGRSTCDLARLSLAVWQAKPEAFETFHDWLMESAEIPSLDAARARATEILGPAGLAQALASPTIARQLEAGNRLYHACGEGKIPKLLANQLTITGEPDNAVGLFGVLEKMGLTPP